MLLMHWRLETEQDEAELLAVSHDSTKLVISAEAEKGP